MTIRALLRAAQILRAQPGYSMPVVKLHARLVHELGSEVGSYAELYRLLKNRPEDFMLLDTPRVLPDASGWPQQVREEYENALETAGLGACVRVALTEMAEADDESSPFALAGRTLSNMWPAAHNDDALRQFLSTAAEQLAEIGEVMSRDEAGRPTTPLRDPR